MGQEVGPLSPAQIHMNDSVNSVKLQKLINSLYFTWNPIVPNRFGNLVEIGPIKRLELNL